ncbi:hypothetical protein LIA77_03914 [Sarocladium implicatum]|nr:hypothetical protein LIA77_03914 [Sarocladium implicatum]
MTSELRQFDPHGVLTIGRSRTEEPAPVPRTRYTSAFLQGTPLFSYAATHEEGPSGEGKEASIRRTIRYRCNPALICRAAGFVHISLLRTTCILCIYSTLLSAKLRHQA